MVEIDPELIFPVYYELLTKGIISKDSFTLNWGTILQHTATYYQNDEDKLNELNKVFNA